VRLRSAGAARATALRVASQTMENFILSQEGEGVLEVVSVGTSDILVNGKCSHSAGGKSL